MCFVLGEGGREGASSEYTVGRSLFCFFRMKEYLGVKAAVAGYTKVLDYRVYLEEALFTHASPGLCATRMSQTSTTTTGRV